MKIYLPSYHELLAKVCWRLRKSQVVAGIYLFRGAKYILKTIFYASKLPCSVYTDNYSRLCYPVHMAVILEKITVSQASQGGVV